VIALPRSTAAVQNGERREPFFGKDHAPA